MRDFINEMGLLNEAIFIGDAQKVFSAIIKKTLGLDIDAASMSPTEMKPLYRKASMKSHPDLGGSVEAMQELNAVWDVLQNGTSSSFGGARPRRPDADADRGYGYTSRASRDSGEDYPVWAMAGYSGGMRPSTTISRNSYEDLNFFKKRMWELSGKSRQEWTIWNFDGTYFRGVVTVYGSASIFDEMAKAMYEWDRFYKKRAIFVTRKEDKNVITLIWADDKSYAKEPIEFTHESFNANPGNDQDFVRQLPAMLDHIEANPDGKGDDQFYPYLG
jgi:hypothetical protein